MSRSGCCAPRGRTAVKARTQAVIQIKSILVSAPDALRDELRPLKAKQLVERCANARPSAGRDPLTVTRRVLRSVARRHRMLDAEIAALEAELDELVALAAPRLLAEHSVARETAAKLLTLAGDNPDRLRNHSALAALCGASPVEASSGKTKRHRLNRGGDRQANNALYTIAMVRMQHTPRPRPTSPAAPRKARPAARSAAASCATSPAASTRYSSPTSKTPRPSRS